MGGPWYSLWVIMAMIIIDGVIPQRHEESKQVGMAHVEEGLPHQAMEFGL